MSSDSVVLSKAMFEPSVSKPATEKQVLVLNDSNSGSYNGNIVFDTTVLSNSGRWLDYSDAVLAVPLALSLRSTGNISASAHAYMCGLKSGYHQLIDSIQVDYLNRNVVQQQSFTNFFVSYKMMSEWSDNDLIKYGDLCGFWPDAPAGTTRATAANARGDGYANNTPYNVGNKSFATTAPLDQSNEGLRRRLELTAQTTDADYANLNTTTTAVRLQNIGKNYYVNDGGAAAARIYTWYILATIRLKDVCDFFDKIPLLKGAQIRMTINYNSARCVVAGVNAGPTMALTSTTMLSGRTVPFMMCDATANQAGNALVAANGDITVEYNIRQTATPACAANPLMSSCQLYVPAYNLSPDVESSYISSFPIKTIIYDDIYQFTVSAISAGSNFNSILTNGILNPQKLVIIPMVASGSTGNSQEEFRSPFDSAPATTGPLVSLQNWQVSVSGKNVFDHPVKYDFEEFQQEVVKSGVYGGQITGQASGLISQKAWQYGYRYYVADISRRLQSSDNVPLAIQITGTNNSGAGLDLYCFITYQRSIQVDVATGIPVQ